MVLLIQIFYERRCNIRVNDNSTTLFNKDPCILPNSSDKCENWLYDRTWYHDTRATQVNKEEQYKLNI